MVRRLPAVLAGALLLVAPRPSTATVLLPASLEELARGALAIAQGRVMRVESRWAEGRRRIETLVAIEVRQYLKGDLGATIVFRIPGGEIGRYRSVMVGAPTFRPGDDVIVFLGAHGPSFPFLLGLGQGVFRLARDEASGRMLVVPPPVSLAAAGAGPVVRGAPHLKPWPLERFVEEVRGLATSAARDPERPNRRVEGRLPGGRP